jgi:hypothetical protein
MSLQHQFNKMSVTELLLVNPSTLTKDEKSEYVNALAKAQRALNLKASSQLLKPLGLSE